MTQKELLYVEDAICHEENVLAYLENMLSEIQEDFETIIDEHIKKHQNIQKKLKKLLEDIAND